MMQTKDQGGIIQQNPWFGQDGRLVAMPNPIQRMATRPPVLDDSSSNRYYISKHANDSLKILPQIQTLMYIYS